MGAEADLRSGSAAGPLALRCLLFVPGSRPDRFAKAEASGADAVAVDLEDAVAPGDKDDARRAALDWLTAPGEGPLRMVRINPLDTAAGLRDLLALAGARARAVLMPKVEAARDVELAAAHLAGMSLVPLIETVRGLREADAIAAHPATAALMLGGADLAAELGCDMAWEPLLAARSGLVMSAASADKPAIDVPYIALSDPDGLAGEAARVRALGFAAKAAIHPAQVGAIAAAFTPSAQEVEHARRIVEAHDAHGLAQLDGRLVEAPVARRSERLLALADRFN